MKPGPWPRATDSSVVQGADQSWDRGSLGLPGPDGGEPGPVGWDVMAVMEDLLEEEAAALVPDKL